MAILEDRQLPLWCPYVGGGYPIIAHPESPSLSPFVLPSLLFGEVAGLKVNLLACWLLFAAGVYKLARTAAGCAPWPAFSAAAIASLSGWFPERIRSGNANELSVGLLPWLVVLWLQAWRQRRSRPAVAAAALIAVLTVDGKTNLLVIGLVMLLLAVLFTADRVQGRVRLTAAPLAAFAAVWALALPFSAAKTLPMARLLGLFSGERLHIATHLQDPTGQARPGHAAGHYLHGLVSRDSEVTVQLSPVSAPERPKQVWKVAAPSRLYVGWPAAVLLLAALPMSWRRAWRWWVLLAVLFWLGLGPHAPLDLLALLRRLPLFTHLLAPSKYFSLPALLALGMVCGCGVDVALARSRRLRLRHARAGALVCSLLVLAVLAPLQANAWRVLRPVFDAPRPSPAREEFYQVHGLSMLPQGRRPPKADMYYNLCRGVGTIDWYTPIERPVRGEAVVQPAAFIRPDDTELPNPRYCGDVYLADANGRIEAARLTFNTLEVVLETAGPATLVVNQNHAPGWKSSLGKVVSCSGLLGVEIPSAGRHRLVLSYRPREFALGMAVTAGSISALLAAWLFPRARGVALWPCRK